MQQRRTRPLHNYYPDTTVEEEMVWQDIQEDGDETQKKEAEEGKLEVKMLKEEDENVLMLISTKRIL